jgi:hypothetical protein
MTCHDARMTLAKGHVMTRRFARNDLIPLPPLRKSPGRIEFLAHLARVRRELEMATRIDQAKIIRDQAAAIQNYLKQSGETLEIQNMAAEIRIRAERRLGQILGDMENHPPGRKSQLGDMMSPNLPPKLVDMGISNKQSSRWQQIASIPESRFEERIGEIKLKHEELTAKEFIALAGQWRRYVEQLERRNKSSADAALIDPDDHIRLFHGDFREVLNEVIEKLYDRLVAVMSYGLYVTSRALVQGFRARTNVVEQKESARGEFANTVSKNLKGKERSHQV